MDQLWTDFRATLRIDPPEEPARVAELLAWAIEAGGKELGDAKRFDVKPKDKEMLDVQVHPEGSKLLVALCERDSRGGGLGRQMTEALKKAAGKTPVVVRTTDFPPARPGGVVAEQLGALLRKGGRRVVVGDTELRDLMALRNFRERHAGEAALLEWSRTARPITRLKSVSDILGLEKPDAPPKGGTGVPMGNVGARSTATKAQTELFNSPPTLPYGTPVPAQVLSGAKSTPPARAETSALEARGVRSAREPIAAQRARQGRAESLSDDPLQDITIESPMLTGRTMTPPRE